MVETYIDSFRNKRPLDELEELIEQEKDLKDLLESLRSPPAVEQQQDDSSGVSSSENQQALNDGNTETAQSDSDSEREGQQ